MDISGELAQIASYKGFFALPVGGTANGWHPVRRDYDAGFADLIDATARRYRTGDLRIAASLVQLGHASRLWSPALACAVAHHVVPNLEQLDRADDGARLRLPEPVGQAVSADPDAAARALYDAVVRQHLQPLAAGLRVKLAPGLLAGNLGSALAGAARALLSARPDLRGPILQITDSLLNTGVLSGTGVVTDAHLGFRRGSCCLFYRLPGQSVCADCVFRAHGSARW
ncbi:(2Fe-2S)-binding protein [Mycobacterium sherrisii]|uniref:(2Fe-2S)-binding protein n=1 Tax=Mycobacterium sherrisii TaxID=243061 RepID=UPI000A16BB6E|nr:(2Fe-2S)-binding protein [Mycobacterium sherrisii]MCV7028862.1 (2Fe-2S)-binding protein [Mycobacterium sherrisii]MEC4761727.1 (2Fe-2S)-binding protein [Mycobacterium sherrisii]ORW82606.1 iron reductase [Mycobacterium sherrisii]